MNAEPSLTVFKINFVSIRIFYDYQTRLINTEHKLHHMQLSQSTDECVVTEAVSGVGATSNKYNNYITIYVATWQLYSAL